MNVAFLSESPADEGALGILVAAILGEEFLLTPSHPRLRNRGWPAVRQVLPAVLRHLHYQTDTESLVVVVDANGDPAHVEGTLWAEVCQEGCRLCELRTLTLGVQASLSPRPAGRPLMVAIGLALPAIESWYRCGLDVGVNENTWVPLGDRVRDREARLQLKRDVYGTDRPSLELETRRACEEARRIADDINALERTFPSGFGSLAADIRGWGTE